MSDLFTEAEAPTVYTIDMQIAAVEREIKYRERVYARLVQNNQMSGKEAAYQLGVMRAVANTLRESN